MEENKNISVDQPRASTSMGEEEQVVIDNDNTNSTESWITKVKRRKISFARQTNVISRNDIIVYDHLNKIKVEEDVQKTVGLKEEVDSVVGDSMKVDENVIAKFQLTPCVVRLERLQLTDSRLPGISTRSSEATSSNEAEGSERQDVQPDSGTINQPEPPVSSSSKGDETQVAQYKLENDQLKACNEQLVKLLNEKNLENSLLREKISQLELRLVGLTIKRGIGSNDDGSVGLGAATSSSEGCRNCQSSNGRTVNGDPVVTSPTTAPENTRNELAQRVSALEDDNRILKNIIAKNMEASKTKLTSEEIVTGSANNVIPQEEQQQMENAKVVKMFDQVVRVLVQKRKPLGQTKWADQMEMLKTMRLVCKTWKESVDRLLKNDPVHLILCSNSSLLQFKRNFTPCSTIIMNNDVGKTNLGQFLGNLKKNMADYPTFDPLLTGHLMIDVDTELTTGGQLSFAEEWNKFAEMIVDLLMTLGDRVLYLTVGLKAKSNLTSALEKTLGDLLMKWLHLTPNLKSLCMEFVKFLVKRSQNNFIVSLDQVPHLKHLETIQNCGGIVLHQLLKRNRQVSRLHLGGSTFYLSKILDMKLENLSEVGLFFGACHPSSGWFLKLNSVQWQPRGLTLIYPMRQAHSQYDDVGFLSPRLKNKLDHISLGLVTSQMSSCSHSQVEWDLPLSLKQMRIKWCADAWFPINLKKLLKKVKLLETLELEVGMGDRDITKVKRLGVDTSDNGKKERMQRFWLFVNALGTANYWKCFPQLRSVKIKLVVKQGGQMTIEQRDIVRSGVRTIGFQYIKIGNEADYNGF